MDLSRNIRKNKYDRVMPRLRNQSGSTLKSSSFVTRHDMPSSARVGARTSVSNVSSGVFSDLPVVLNDYVPEVSSDKIRKSLVVKPRRTIKSLDPNLSPHRTVTKSRENVRSAFNRRFQESAPALLTSNGNKWSDTHVKQCLSSRSHSRLKELKSEIHEFRKKEKLMKLRSDLYKKCGVVLDDVGNVGVDKEVQVEHIEDDRKQEKPTNEDIRRLVWLSLINREELIDYNPTSYVVCEKHFAPHQIIKSKARKTLKRGAVPSLNLPPNVANVKITQVAHIKTEVIDPDPDEAVIATSYLSQEACQDQQMETYEVTMEEMDVDEQCDVKPVIVSEESYSNITKDKSCVKPSVKPNDHNFGFTLSDMQLISINSSTLEKVSRCIQTEPKLCVSRDSQTPNYLTSSTPRKKKLMTELNNCKKIIKSHESEKHKTSTFIDLCHNYLNKELAKLIKEQMRQKKGNHGNRYSMEYKIFCTNLFYTSPKAYDLLRSVLCLPSPSTIDRFSLPTTTVDINNLLLSTLGAKVKEMTTKDRISSVLIGTMALTPKLFYDIEQDKVIGFQEVDGVQTPVLATKSLVVMVQGVFGEWMQPIAYALLPESKNISNMAEWIDTIILKLLKIGLDVRTLVSDINTELFLAAAKRSVSTKTPYFYLNNRKIYYIFDPPRLMKLARNTLMTNHFHFNGRTSKWEHVEQFYEQDKNKDLKLAHKITDNHFNKPVNLRLALEMLSKSVAAAMSAYVEFNAIDKSAEATVILITKLNDLFDILNSSSPQEDHKYKRAYCADEFQTSYLEEMLKFFQDLDITTCHGRKAQILRDKLTEGFQITIKAIMLLYEDLKLEGYYHLLTRRLNIDSISTFFDQIRANKLTIKPNSRQFVGVFCKIFFSNIVKPPTDGAGTGNWLKILKKSVLFNNIDTEADKSSVACSSDIEWETSPSVRIADYNQLELPETDSLSHVCSFLLQKSFKQDKNCILLKSYMRMDETSLNNSGSIDIPADDFLQFVRVMDEQFQEAFNGTQISGKLSRIIFQKFFKLKFKAPCPCFPLAYLKKLFIRLKLRNTLWYNNNKIMAARKCVNKRAKKIKAVTFSVPSLN